MGPHRAHLLGAEREYGVSTPLSAGQCHFGITLIRYGYLFFFVLLCFRVFFVCLFVCLFVAFTSFFAFVVLFSLRGLTFVVPCAAMLAMEFATLHTAFLILHFLVAYALAPASATLRSIFFDYENDRFGAVCSLVLALSLAGFFINYFYFGWYQTRATLRAALHQAFGSSVTTASSQPWRISWWDCVQLLWPVRYLNFHPDVHVTRNVVYSEVMEPKHLKLKLDVYRCVLLFPFTHILRCVILDVL